MTLETELWKKLFRQMICLKTNNLIFKKMNTYVSFETILELLHMNILINYEVVI